MINLKQISKGGANYYLLQGYVFGKENGVFYKMDKTTFIKSPICYGAIMLQLYNGSTIYFTNNTFYIKEQL